MSTSINIDTQNLGRITNKELPNDPSNPTKCSPIKIATLIQQAMSAFEVDDSLVDTDAVLPEGSAAREI